MEPTKKQLAAEKYRTNRPGPLNPIGRAIWDRKQLATSYEALRTPKTGNN